MFIRPLFGLIIFLLSCFYSATAAVIDLSSTADVVMLDDYAGWITTGTEARLNDVADDRLQPFERNVKKLPGITYLRNLPEQCDWLFFPVVNNETVNRRLFFYLGSNMHITVYRYDVNTKVTDTVPIVDYFRKEGSFIFPMDFPALSTTNLCFRIGKGNRPNYSLLFSIAASEPGAIRERLHAVLLKSDENLFFQRPIELLFMGMIIGIMFFAAFHYFQTREMVFVYYFIYLLFILLFIGTRMAEVFSADVLWYHLGYFRDLTWQPLSYLFYFLFSMHFVDFGKHGTDIYRLLKVLVYLLLIYVGVDLVFAVMEKLAWRRELYFYFRLSLIPIALYLITRTFLIPDRFARILAMGSLAMAGGAIAAFSIQLFSDSHDSFWYLYQMQIMYAGIVIELLFFTGGLSLKTKAMADEKASLAIQLELERELKEIEKRQTAIDVQQSERERFAQDLHDDLGSGLTSIRFLSEAIRKNPSDIAVVEKISNLADEMNRNMRQIVWAMQSGNRSLVDLSRFIKSQVNDLLEINNIGFSCRIDDALPDFPLSGLQVRSIGLTVKETVNNILKHSGARAVDMDIFHQEEKIMVSITDNGTGIEVNDDSTVNGGLVNMKQRMNAIGGNVEWRSAASGTRVMISFPIPDNVSE